MFQYEDVRGILQECLDKFDLDCKNELARKMYGSNDFFEMKYIAGMNVGAAQLARMIMEKLKTWEEIDGD